VAFFSPLGFEQRFPRSAWRVTVSIRAPTTATQVSPALPVLAALGPPPARVAALGPPRLPVSPLWSLWPPRLPVSPLWSLWGPPPRRAPLTGG